MKTEIQPLEDRQVKITVEFEADELEKARQRAARRVSQQVKIPGFRPGKAPYNVVLRFAGQDYITDQAIELLVDETYPKLLDEHHLEPYGPGELKDIPSREPLKVEYVVPLQPQVVLNDYRAVRIPYEAPVIAETEVEEALQRLRQQHAIIENVERPAQVGDEVSIRLSAQRKQVAEGQSAVLLPERPQLIRIQADPPADEWPFPGFSAHLVGMSVGESKTVSYTFPESSPFEALRGQEAEYVFLVEEVKERRLPALDNEFAHTAGDFENVEALRQAIRTNLERVAQRKYDAEYTSKILAKLLETASIEYPPMALEKQIDSMLDSLKNRLADQGMELETYLKTRRMDLDALRQEFRPVAERRLKEGLVLSRVAEQENIRLDPEEINSRADETVGKMSHYLSPKEARKILTEDFYTSLFIEIGADLLYDRSIERLHAIAKGELIEPPTETAPAEDTTPQPAETDAAPGAQSDPAA